MQENEGAASGWGEAWVPGMSKLTGICRLGRLGLRTGKRRVLLARESLKRNSADGRTPSHSRSSLSGGEVERSRSL